jgi:hypothetical protein
LPRQRRIPRRDHPFSGKAFPRPDAPVAWLDEFTVNLNTPDNQSRPTITQLTNGNTLVV